MHPADPASAPPSDGNAEFQLQRSLLAAFLENVPDYVYFKDRQSRFIAVSRSKAARHGLTPAAMVGKSDFDTFADVHARPAFEDEQRIIQTGAPLLDTVQKLTWPDGHVTWVRTNKLPLRDETGAIIGTFGISQDITESRRLSEALERSNRELVFASRMAGMAEVATGVLHNVGNVLTSLNVSASMVTTGLRQSKVESLARIAALLKENAADLPGYFARDPKSALIPDFVDKLAAHFGEERARLLSELESLQKNIDHIKDIVAMQQAYAHMAGVVEPLDACALFEDAVRMNAGALARHDVQVVRAFQPVPAVRAEKAKVLQILVNLIRNAKYALDDGAPPEKVMTLGIELGAPGWVRLVVSDNGIGIAAEHLQRVFERGFTTRKEGHGFGLSSAITAARELKGSLTVRSAGPGKGASFTLELPVADDPPPAAK